MRTVLVSDIDGAVLDWVVGVAVGLRLQITSTSLVVAGSAPRFGIKSWGDKSWCPHLSEVQLGRLQDDLCVSSMHDKTRPNHEAWEAVTDSRMPHVVEAGQRVSQLGETRQVAVLRAIAEAHFGQNLEVPEELFHMRAA